VSKGGAVQGIHPIGTRCTDLQCHGLIRCANRSFLQISFESSTAFGQYTKNTSNGIPTNSSAWIKFAELESQLEDFQRTRGIFELGISQPSLSMPELLWKAYIDFETEEGEREKARSLYERLVKLSGHVKVWISYALFEGEAIPVPRAEREDEDEDEDEEKEVKMVEGDLELARQVFKKGIRGLEEQGSQERGIYNTYAITFQLRLTFTLSL
jgi:hypothetical protein